MNPREKAETRIAKLSAEIRRLKKLTRIKRQPALGIGGTIQVLREAKGLTLSELAKRAGLSKGLVSRIERGKWSNPEYHTLAYLADGLGLKTSELIVRDENRDGKRDQEGGQ